MIPRSLSIRRSLLPVFVGALAVLGLWAATVRAAAPVLYGGLGTVGELHAVLSTAPDEPGDVVAEGEHAFAVDDEDGSYYIGDKLENEETGEQFIRVQKFEKDGKFVAENRIQTYAEGFEGFAIDPKEHRLYLLLVEETTKAGAPAAVEVWSFSTEGTLEAKKLDGAEQLHANSKAEALIEPRGITVDPTTHDVLILGQENVPARGGEPEYIAAAVQRVHTDGVGKLGPRYVDQGNCLVEGVPSKEEEEEALAKGLTKEDTPCAESPGPPFSAAASPAGRLYTERTGGEIWEIPSSAGASEVFESATKPKEYPSPPKRLFALSGGGRQHILELAEGETGGTMAIASGPGGTRIYLDAEVTSSAGRAAGVLLLGYTESGAPAASVIGWTGGLPESEKDKNPNCVVPVASSAPAIGADGEEHTLLFNVVTKVPEMVSVMRFGAGSGAAQCANASATPPKVESGTAKEVTHLPRGREAKLTSEVIGANAESVEWKLKNTTSDKEETIPSSGYEYQMPTLAHKFEEAGVYEITEIISPDDFGPSIEGHVRLTVEELAMTAKFTEASVILAGKATTFTAHVMDENEAEAKLTYVWEFGDGTKAEYKEHGAELQVEHTYASPASYEVKLTVTDKGGHSTKQAHTIVVTKEEEHKVEEHKEEHPGTGKTEVPPPPKETNPEARLASTSLSAGATGAVTLMVEPARPARAVARARSPCGRSER